MKQIFATWKGYEVQVDRLSHFPGRVNVTTVDGTKPFTKYFYGFGVGDDSSGIVFQDDLENIRVVDDTLECDPFAPDDTQPEIEREYDPAEEWNYTTSYMRRGE